MKLYIKSIRNGSDAIAEFDKVTETITVLKGSRVSNCVAHSEKFRGAKSIEKLRAEYVENSVVVKNVMFKSSSTAANFVMGTSTNGLIAWKDKDGKTLKAILSEEKINHEQN